MSIDVALGVWPRTVMEEGEQTHRRESWSITLSLGGRNPDNKLLGRQEKGCGCTLLFPGEVEKKALLYQTSISLGVKF